MLKEIAVSIVAVCLALSLLWKFYFLRNPERVITKKGIVSPADGIITDVVKFDKPEIEFKKGILGRVRTITHDVGKKGYLIGIFLSIFDVHYQRAPIEGVVTFDKHHDGRFKLGFDFMSSLKNERNEVIIRGENHVVKVVQVAGFVARRIESYVKEGQHIGKGNIIGRINLGSHVALIIPEKRIKVKKGDRVKAGVTVIAE